MLIKSVRGFTPQYGKNCFIADNATLVGELIMGDYCSVWFQAVLRGDVNRITIGDRVNIQDGAIIHGTFEQSATSIGNDVSIGHNAIIHGCSIEDKVLVGMGSIIMDDSIVGRNSIIAAGSVLPKKTIVSQGSIFAGIPAKKIREVSPKLSKEEIERIATNYIQYASWFK